MRNKGQGLEQGPETAQPGGKHYLFAIAIDQYQHSPPLYNCVRDVERITGILHQHYQFEPEHTFTLYNEAATEKRIFDTFKKLVRIIGPEDRLLILYSGHGEYEQDIEEGYWIPVDAQLGDFSDYVSNSRIIKYLKALQAHHILLIVDSCFSGTLFASRKAQSASPALRLDAIPSRWLITAGRNEVVSDGKPGDHSPFADNIIYFLENNKEHSLSAAALSNAVIGAVVYNARQTPRGEPLQDVGHRGGQFFFHKKDYVPPGKESEAESTGASSTKPDGTNQPSDFTGSGWRPSRNLLLTVSGLIIAAIVGLWLLRPLISPRRKPLQTKKTENLATQQVDRPPTANEEETAATPPPKDEQEQTSSTGEEAPLDRAERAWLAATSTDTEAAYRRYIERFPNSKWRSEAEQNIARNYRYNVLFSPVLKSGKRLEIHFSRGKAPFDIRIEQPTGLVIEQKWDSGQPFYYDFDQIERNGSGLNVLRIIVTDYNFKKAGHVLPLY